MIQLFFTLLLSKPGHSLPSRLLRRFLWKVRSFIVRFADPNVQWRIGRFPCLLPLSHNLPSILQSYPHYCGFIVRIARFLDTKAGTFPMIDIGANIGDTALMVRNEIDSPILCVEGNPAFYELLGVNTGALPEIYQLKALLGSRSSNFSGKLTQNAGTSFVTKEEGVGSVQTISLDDALEAYPQFRAARLVKIDTDGYDLEILRGATALLRRSHPVLVFEYDPRHLHQAGDDGLSIFPYLRELGYSYSLVYDNYGTLILGASLANEQLFADIDAYCLEKPHGLYVDLCLFHSSNEALGMEFHLLERKFSHSLRK